MEKQKAFGPVTTIINEEISQGHGLRIPLLKDIGEHFQGTIVSFFATHAHWQGSLNDDDAKMLKDILVSIGETSNLLLVIDSPGGDPHAAERVIKICRERVSGQFITIVPDKAKSAATMICLGSDKIVMMPSSELGPIDVQVPWGDRLIPAHVVIKSYEELMTRCIETPLEKRVEPFLQQLQLYNAAQIEHLRLMRDLAKEIAKKVLKEGMLRNKSGKMLERILRQFLDPEELKSHGRPIFFSDIKKIDNKGSLNVECVSHDFPVYQKIHEYHQRARSHMAANNLVKLCESIHTTFASPVVRG